MATFKEFVDGFNDPDALELWAKNSGLSDLTEVKEKIMDLRFDDITSIINNDTRGSIRTQDNESTLKQHTDTENDTMPYDLDNQQKMLFDDIESIPQIITSDNIIQLEPETLINETENYAMKSDKKEYRIDSAISNSFKNKALIEKSYSVRFNEKHFGIHLSDFSATLENVFKDLLEEGSKEFEPDSKARLYIGTSDLSHPVVIPPKPLADFSVKDIMNHMTRVIQSNKNLSVTAGLSIQLGVCTLPKGGAGGRLRIANFAADKFTKRSIVSIKNDDNLCLARSIACGWACLRVRDAPDADKEDFSREYKHIIRGDLSRKTSRQKKMALGYMNQLGLPEDKVCSLEDIPLFEKLLNISIVVISIPAGYNVIYHNKELTESNSRVYLLYSEIDGKGHFDFIKTLSGVYSSSYFCHKCLKPYEVKKTHICCNVCNLCEGSNCVKEDARSCLKCKRFFNSDACFSRHRTIKEDGGKSICSKYRGCTRCYSVIDLEKRNMSEHVCGEYKCRICREIVPEDHICSLNNIYSKTAPEKRYYYDFECSINGPTHIPLFCVVQSSCTLCEKTPLTAGAKCEGCGDRCALCCTSKKGRFIRPPCFTCGAREKVFSGLETRKDFCNWALSRQHSNSVFIGHYAGGYDTVFVLKHMVENGINPEVSFSGQKILYLKVARGLEISFIDSYKFIPLKLAKLPKAFDLKDTDVYMKKGYFPFLFLDTDTMNYVGPIPPVETYNPDHFMSDDREAFFNWYNMQAEVRFDMKEILYDYCKTDVEILRLSFNKFCNMLEELVAERAEGVETGFKVLSYLTLPAVCFAVFKHLFLREKWCITHDGDEKVVEKRKGVFTDPNTRLLIDPDTVDAKRFIDSEIAILRPTFIKNSELFSRQSILWLKWVEATEGVSIKHALNGREHVLMLKSGEKMKVDGFDENNVVYQYNGCMFHACFRCNSGKMDLIHPFFNKPLHAIYSRTLDRERLIKENGYKLVVMWECDFKALLRVTPLLQELEATTVFHEHLDVRDSFFGGRCQVFKLYHAARTCEKMHYLDFTSLYPSQLKQKRYPVGLPTVIRHDFDKIENYFGFVKCRVLAPKKLLHPVLPVRIAGRLFFTLCTKCATERLVGDCVCTTAERVIEGCFCSVELQKAVDVGYEILEFIEVQHFTETRVYDSVKGEHGLFSEYVDMFLKLKQQSSGFPPEVVTESQKQTYIDNYFENEGIKLDREKIEHNAGLRVLSKLCLNSFW